MSRDMMAEIAAQIAAMHGNQVKSITYKDAPDPSAEPAEIDLTDIDVINQSMTEDYIDVRIDNPKLKQDMVFSMRSLTPAERSMILGAIISEKTLQAIVDVGKLEKQAGKSKDAAEVKTLQRQIKKANDKIEALQRGDIETAGEDTLKAQAIKLCLVGLKVGDKEIDVAKITVDHIKGWGQLYLNVLHAAVGMESAGASQIDTFREVGTESGKRE